jgi:Na+-transporting NADH:ubiquinone oxidoreductase subunit C
MPADSVKKTLIVAFGVCIVCSILVSTAAVSLKGIQDENKRLDRIKNILLAGDLLNGDADLRTIYEEKIQPMMIDLSNGKQVPKEEFNEVLNIEDFDITMVAGHPQYGMTIPSEKDTAKINKMPKYTVVYIHKEDNVIKQIILPVYGKGLWSTMYGFVALDTDLKTVRGFTFYDHAETPGLGGEVDNPRWKAIWKGKQIFDEKGDLRIEVIKGTVDTSGSEAQYQIDGLSGATLTARGVNDLVRFWLGDDGYGPFFKRFKEEING